MKGNTEIIKCLNNLLADEMCSSAQYVVHSEMCANWGYTKLHDIIKKRAIEEMKHAEKLIERILFLEGIPDLSGMEKASIGSNIEHQFRYDLEAEESAIRAYNKGITLCTEAGDSGTQDLLQSILIDEEKHIDWLETQMSLVSQISSKNYLVEQI